MSETYTVRVDRGDFVFSAAHFITFNGDQCERLHGHNYRASVEIDGPLDANHYAFDFIALRDTVLRLVAELDHYVLLPTLSELIQIEEMGSSVRARFGEREWSFPRGDCVLLPVANTTSEMLARHLAGRLREELARRYGFTPLALRLEVEETAGQSARYAWVAQNYAVPSTH